MSAKRAWLVPGRIEVLGKHTDYAGGRSLLAAVHRGFRVTSVARTDAQLVVRDRGRGVTLEGALDPELVVATRGGANYAMTVARRVARTFPDVRRGADITIESDLPNAAGLSSSSAMMIGVFLAIADANDLESKPAAASIFRTKETLAGYLAAIENGEAFAEHAGDRGVGTSGGSQDHTAILCCREGELAQYAFCPVRHEASLPLDEQWLFAIGASGVSASKTGAAHGAYKDATDAVAVILDIWRASTGRSDFVLAHALASTPDAADRMRQALERAAQPRLLARLNQFVEESSVIIPAASDALARGDMPAFGALVDRSQALAESSLGNQVPETIALARLARELGASAASAFGAGFGGSVWALIPRSDVGDFLERWIARYRHAFPEAAARAVFFTTRPGPGASRLRGGDSAAGG